MRQIRPCFRRNFPNFLFSRVSEMFGCRSLKFFFGKNRNFWTREIFTKKFGKKFRNLSSEKSLGINRSCTSISKISKKLWKVWVFESKNSVFASKSLEKVRKSLEKFVNRVFRTFGNFGNCSIPNFPKITKKMTLNSNFGNHEKLIPTRFLTRKFG